MLFIVWFLRFPSIGCRVIFCICYPGIIHQYNKVTPLKVLRPTSYANVGLVSRIYIDPFYPDDRILLRFSHPKHLQKFLNNLPKIQVAGRQLEAQLFYNDAEKKKFKPFTVLRRQDTPETILKPRRSWMPDSANLRRKSEVTRTTTIVTVGGIPFPESRKSVEYWAKYMLEDEQFEWAFEWDYPMYGDTSPSKQNVVCVDVR